MRQTADAEHVTLIGVRAASEARTFVRDRLRGSSRDLVETAELLTSEVVTNGVVHAQTGLEIGVAHVGDEILVSVSDANAHLPHAQPPPDVNVLAQNGRGMAIIIALADDFGWLWQPDRSGKVVWFTLKIEGGQRDGRVPAAEIAIDTDL